jgi:hypothetical protein
MEGLAARPALLGRGAVQTRLGALAVDRYPLPGSADEEVERPM